MRSITTIAFSAALIGLGAGLPVSVSAVCVIANDAADLRTQISNAQGSTTTTVIMVPRGTYNLGGSALVFNSSVAGQGQFDITGGYNSDCSTHIYNPALTIIDGQGLSGNVLDLRSLAGISVRDLTIQGAATPGTGFGPYVQSYYGGIIIDYNIFRNNAAISHAGIAVTLVGASAVKDIHVDGNLIVGNTAVSQYGAGFVNNLGTGSTYITNNTIAGNISQGVGGYGGLVVHDNGTAAGCNISNNILWGNSNIDLDLQCTNPALMNNDYQYATGNGFTGTGNVHVDPQFSSSSDFHLSASSPLLGLGLCNPKPAGGLPTIDIVGNPRTYDLTYVAATCKVDMGAYERGNEIFKDGFSN